MRENFSREDFAGAFESFRRLYQAAPQIAIATPDVIARFCELYGAAGENPHGHSMRLVFNDCPLVAGVLAPWTLAMEGEVDEERMGDW